MTRPVVRRALLRSLADREVVELAISRSDLDRAAAVWIVNSVRGWVPIILVTDTSTVLGRTRRRY